MDCYNINIIDNCNIDYFLFTKKKCDIILSSLKETLANYYELQEFNSTKIKNKNFSSECFPKSQEKDTGELEKINTIINTDNSDENIKKIEQISIDVEKSI